MSGNILGFANSSAECKLLEKTKSNWSLFLQYISIKIFYIKRAEPPHCLSLEQHDQWKSLVKCKHIFFTSDGLKFSVWWVTLNSKPFPKVRNFEYWNLIPRVRKFDSKFLFLIKVPTLSRGSPSPLRHNIDSCIIQLRYVAFPFPFLKANRKHCKQAKVRTIQANLSDIQTNRSAI